MSAEILRRGEAFRPRPTSDAGPVAIAKAVALGLAIVLAFELRRMVVAAGTIDGLAIGVWFAASLSSIAVLAGWRPSIATRGRSSGDRPPGPKAILGPSLAGIGGAGLLIGVVLMLGPDPVALYGPAGPPLAWFAVTSLVATVEEVAFRGALFDTLQAGWGPGAALILTSGLFGVAHASLYGPASVPADVAAGLLFGGLRLASGGLVAPAVAHVLADLATAWL